MRIWLPIILLVLEVIALAGSGFVNLPELPEGAVRHAITILMIATLGWIIWGIVAFFYHRFLRHVGDQEHVSISGRSTLTQVLFLYRFLIFVIIIVTIALILLTFPYIKNVGVGILGSAGIAGLALGIAARPILLNLISGFQIALNKTVNIGDQMMFDGETARVESMHLTHIIFRTWDLRRIVVPISRFIDQSFQNWDAADTEMIGWFMFYCDYKVPVDQLRDKVSTLVKESPFWNKKFWKVQVTDFKEQTMEIRISASANDASDAFDLKAELREKLIEFIKKEYPQSLPCVRNLQLKET